MSLTSELKNPNSPIRKWFDLRHTRTIDKIINHHNKILSQSQIISPQQGTNFPVVGNAVCYALRKYIANKLGDTNWHYTSLAWHGARYLQLIPLFNYCINSNKTVAIKVINFILYDSLYYSIIPVIITFHIPLIQLSVSSQHFLNTGS